MKTSNHLAVVEFVRVEFARYLLPQDVSCPAPGRKLSFRVVLGQVSVSLCPYWPYAVTCVLLGLGEGQVEMG